MRNRKNLRSVLSQYDCSNSFEIIAVISNRVYFHSGTSKGRTRKNRVFNASMDQMQQELNSRR